MDDTRPEDTTDPETTERGDAGPTHDRDPTPEADGGVAVDRFETVCDRLAAWCADGDGQFRVETVDGTERAVCEFGTASLVVGADGRVEGGMPLHGFEGRATELVFEGTAVRVRGEDLNYVYRRPR